MSTYTGADIIDLDVTTPTEDSTPPSEVNDAIREIKTVYKNQNATIVKSTNYTLTSTDSLVLVSGNTTITVPESSGVSSSAFLKQYTIIKTDSSATTVTIARSGSDTFNGATSQTLKIQYSGIILFGSGVVDWKALFTLPITFGNDTTKFLRDDGTMAVASSSATVTSISGTVSITAAQCNGLTELYTSASTTANLPASAEGLICSINVGHSDGVTIDPNGTETLTVEGTSLGAGVSLNVKAVGARIMLFATGTGGWKVVTFNSKRTVQSIVSADMSTTSTSWAASTLAVTITAGVSGKVELSFDFGGQMSGGASHTYFRLNRGSIGSPSGLIYLGRVYDETQATNKSANVEVTGLTPGTSYTWTLDWYVNTNGIYCRPGTYPETEFGILIAETW